jgi:hypothetical protein
VGQPGQITREIIGQLVDDLVLVDEGDIEQAIVMLLEIEKTLVEGAGAAGLAALLKDPARYAGQKVGLVLCGGNIDPLLLAAILERGMVRAGRLARIKRGARATHPACWRASPPWLPKRAPTSTKCTTSARSRRSRHRTSRWKWCCRHATRRRAMQAIVVGGEVGAAPRDTLDGRVAAQAEVVEGLEATLADALVRGPAGAGLHGGRLLVHRCGVRAGARQGNDRDHLLKNADGLHGVTPAGGGVVVWIEVCGSVLQRARARVTSWA